MSLEERSTGIILRTHPLSETSLIVRWLTADLGRIDTAAKGAQRPKSPLRGKLDLFYEADLSFARSRRSELHTLREVRLRDTHAVLREDLGRLHQASYGATLVEQTTEKETPLPAIYQLVSGLLRHLSSQPARPRTVFAFELKLLRELGLEPDWADSRLSAATRSLARTLIASDWAELGALQATAAQAKELRQFLFGFLTYHLGKVPAGRAGALARE